MHLNLETTQQHAIQSYDSNRIQIDSIIYEASLIVSKEEIISSIALHHINEIDAAYVALLLRHKPELIIIGHCDVGMTPDINLLCDLSRQRIGIEFMSIGAACRTYNLLLGEHRAVVAGFIF